MDPYDHEPPDDRRDPMLNLSFGQLVALSPKDFRFLKAQQAAFKAEQRELKRYEAASREARNARIADHLNLQDAIDRRDADRQRARDAQMAEYRAQCERYYQHEGDE